MRVIDIALKDLLIILKDKKALAMIVLMPIALIFVLGMGLSSAFKSDGGGIKQFDVALVDKDGGEEAKQFKDFLNINEIKKLVNVKEMNYDEAIENGKKGKVPAVIVLPEGYSKAIRDGKEIKIHVLEDPGSSLKSNIVKSIVKSYSDMASSISVASPKAAEAVFSAYNFHERIDYTKILSVVNENTSSNFRQENVEGRKIVSAMQYYSAAMLVMYVLFIALLGTSSIIEEREQKTLLRLMGTTISKRSIITGKLLGLFVICVLDVSVLIVFTKYVFNADWGNSISGIILLSGALLFAACGLAMLIASLFKTTKSVQAVSSPLVMVMSFLGGSMYPIYEMPDAMQTAAKIVPNNWGLKGYISLMLGNGVDSIITNVLVLLAFGLVMLAIGIFKLRLD